VAVAIPGRLERTADREAHVPARAASRQRMLRRGSDVGDSTECSAGGLRRLQLRGRAWRAHDPPDRGDATDGDCDLHPKTRVQAGDESGARSSMLARNARKDSGGNADAAA
jgi:hypothetical protein